MLTWHHSAVLPIAPLSPPGLLDIVPFCLRTLYNRDGERERKIERERKREIERQSEREREEESKREGGRRTELEVKRVMR